jgi:Na+-translocating ferredoxin:NAD+ oxidoreductase subunit E
MNKPSALHSSLTLMALIGASDSLVKAVGLSLASVLVISLYGLGMKGLRRLISSDLQWLAGLVLSATLSSCAALAMQAWAFELHQQLGIYLGLIALQCVLLEHGGFFNGRGQVRQIGTFCLLLITLGALREVLGSGSLGNHLGWLAGRYGVDWPAWIVSPHGHLRLLSLVPGGFILLGLLLAARQAWASTSHRPPSRN